MPPIVPASNTIPPTPTPMIDATSPSVPQHTNTHSTTHLNDDLQELNDNNFVIGKRAFEAMLIERGLEYLSDSNFTLSTPVQRKAFETCKLRIFNSISKDLAGRLSEAKFSLEEFKLYIFSTKSSNSTTPNPRPLFCFVKKRNLLG